jgi:hypothetical protein
MIPIAYACNFICVPTDTASSTLTIAGGLFQDFSVYIYLILGVLLFGTLVAFLIGAFHKH